MKTAAEHYEALYGDLGLSPKDAAKWVFASGWNCDHEWTDKDIENKQ